jgi:hypothetical protein
MEQRRLQKAGLDLVSREPYREQRVIWCRRKEGVSEPAVSAILLMGMNLYTK